MKSPTRLIHPPVAITAAIFLAHLLGLVSLFPSIGSVFNSEPIVEQDWGTHFHHLRSMGAFWDGSHRQWGYNPFFMAGYPSNTIQDFSIKAFELIAILFPAGARVGAFKSSAFLAAALIPWGMFLSGRLLAGSVEAEQAGHDSRVAASFPVIMAALGTLYWWNSYPREMFFYGMIGFPPACCLALVLVAAVWRLTSSDPCRLIPGLVWAVGALALLPLHLQATLGPAGGAVIAAAMNARRMDRRTIVWLTAGVAAAIVINSFWLVPFWSHRADAAPATLSSVPIFTTSGAFDFIRDYTTGPPLWSFRETAAEKPFRWFLLLGGIAGLGTMWRGDAPRRRLAVFLKLNLLFFFAVTYFSGLIPTFARIQPLRFSVLLNFMLSAPAAWFLSLVFQPEAWTRRSRSLAGAAGVALLVAFAMFALNLAQFEKAHRIRAGLPPSVRPIIGWVRDRAPADARVLFEESGDESGFIYDGVYLSSFIPAMTGRELVGGPANLYNDRHHYAEFHGGRLMGRSLAPGAIAGGFSDSELLTFLETYNIGAIVTFTPEAVMRFAALGDLVAFDGRLGDVHFFHVRREPSWTWEGRALIRATYNRIEITGASGPITLRYHWIEGLRAEPPTEIRKKILSGDPIPFIEIPSPPEKLILSVD